MAKFEITDKDGSKYEVIAPDEQSALSAFQKFSAGQTAAPAASVANTPRPASAPAAPQPGVNEGIDAPVYLAQRANRGLADAAGAPVDLLAGGLNLGLFGADKLAELFGGNVDTRIENPVMGSNWIADRAADANDAIGGNLVPPEAVSPGVRTTGEAVRGTTAAVASAMPLASASAQGSKILAPLAKPYAVDPGKTIVRDAVAGGGAGMAAGAYDEYAPDAVQESSFGPIAKMLASIIGGVGASGTEAIVEGSVNAGKNATRNAVLGKADPSAPVNPSTGQPYTRTDMDIAARVAQMMPTNRSQTIANIDDGQRDFAQFATPAETPTVGMLSDDIGMAIQENVLRARDGQRFVERDSARRSAASKQIDESAPRGAEGRAFTQEATDQYDATLKAAGDVEADALARQAAAREDIQRQNADLEGYRANQPQVSTAMAEEFDAARSAARQEKNARYDAADPATPVDGRFLSEAVNRIDAEMPNAERMVAGPYSQIADRVRQVAEAGATYGDLKALRAQISEARKAAVAASGQSVAGSGADVQRLDQLGMVINRLTDEINPEAARYYREEYAPRFKQGKAGEYGAARDRANRTGGESSATRPSEFGDKFLKKPEDAASLRRALAPEASNAPQIEGTGAPSSGVGQVTEQNAMEWMLGDLAKSGVLTDNAKLRYDKFKQWADKNRATVDQFPSISTRVNDELSRAQRGGYLSDQLAADVANARNNFSETQAELRRSALQMAVGFSPENTVGNILGSGDPEVRMAEMVARLQGNRDALDGLKAATRDWIKQKAGTTSSIVGDPEALKLSRAGLNKLFQQNEKTLATLYSPEEMNALRQAHKLMGAEAKLDVSATAGSNTFDKVMAASKQDTEQRKRVLEAALKLKYGNLAGGGLMRTINIFLSSLPDGKRGLEDLLFEMQFNPDLAKHLLTRPVKELNTPMWNSKLNTLLGAATGSREATEQR